MAKSVQRTGRVAQVVRQHAIGAYGVVDGQVVIGRVPGMSEGEATWERLGTVLVRVLAASMRAVYGWRCREVERSLHALANLRIRIRAPCALLYQYCQLRSTVWTISQPNAPYMVA